MRFYFTAILIVLFPFHLFSQDWTEINSARIRSLGNSSVAVCDSFHTNSNPALSAQLKHALFSTDGYIRPSISKIQHYRVAGLFPFKNLNVLASIKKSGFNAFNTTATQIGVAKKLSPSLDVGAMFEVRNTYAESVKSQWNIRSLVGFSYKIQANTVFAGQLSNIEKSFSEQEKLLLTPIIALLGISHRIDKVLLTTQFNASNQLINTFSIGCEYNLNTQISIRSGIQWPSTNASFGAGLINRSWRYDLVSTYHPYLGLSHGLSLQYIVRKK